MPLCAATHKGKGKEIFMEGVYQLKMRNAREELKIYGDIPIPPMRMRMEEKKDQFIKRYGIVIVMACVYTISMILCSAIASKRTEKAVWEKARAEYAEQLEAYKREQQEAEQAAHWLSGDASREAAINQEVDAVAAVISKLNTDAQKATEAACMLARVMNPAYPGSFKEVAMQEKQWMFYDGTDNTFSQHDRKIAESIVRPYMEQGIVPDGLTQDFVYGSWSPNDFVLRNKYETTGTYRTWSAS